MERIWNIANLAFSITLVIWVSVCILGGTSANLQNQKQRYGFCLGCDDEGEFLANVVLPSVIDHQQKIERNFDYKGVTLL